MNLSELSVAELRQLREQLDKELPRREKQEREQAIEQIYGIAHRLNMPLEVLMNTKLPKPKQTRAPSDVLFQDPTNPANRWAGRGPRPAWLKQALAAGAKLDDFRVTDGSLPSTAGELASHTA